MNEQHVRSIRNLILVMENDLGPAKASPVTAHLLRALEEGKKIRGAEPRTPTWDLPPHATH